MRQDMFRSRQKLLGSAISSMLVVFAFTGTQARAVIVLSNRVSSYNITFSDSTFSNANAHYEVDTLATGNSGDTESITNISVKSAAQNFSMFGTPGLTVSNVSLVNTIASADLALSGTSGGFHFEYDTAYANDFLNTGSFGNTWLRRYKDNSGNFALEFQGGGNGIISQGSFEVNVVINGDWSNLGTGPNQTELVGIDSAWTINQDFIFNGTNTVFDASINSYNGSPNPNLDFILHSPTPAVFAPEPASLILLSIGGMGLAAFQRRRR
jgi:hypothetical protein